MGTNQRWIFSLAGVLAVCSSPPSSESRKHLAGLYTGPYFSPQSVGNLTTSVGNTVHLSCRVKQVGRNTVAWVRKSDSRILSIEEDTIVQDNRFLAVKAPARGEWTLVIRNVTTRDEGAYECQISTQSKMSHFVYLKVLVPSVQIDGSPDIFAKAGSTVELTCTVADHSSSTFAIKWTKEGEEIQQEASPDLEEEVREEGGRMQSVLTIRNIGRERLGNYSCEPSGLPHHSIHLHVIDAKEQGLRTNAASSLWPTGEVLLLFLLLLVDVEALLLLLIEYSSTSLRVISRHPHLSISVPISATT